MGIRTLAMGRGERGRGRKRGQAIRLFRFQRYLINGSSFTRRSPDLSEVDPCLPLPFLCPAVRLSFFFFLLFPMCRNHFGIRLGLSAIFFPYPPISGNAPLSPISIFSANLVPLPFICRLTLVEPADYVTHAF